MQQGIEWDSVEYFSFDKTRAMRHTPVDHPIPSDCRYREDIVWVKREEKVQAEIWKLKLEAIQRFDRGLRADGHKKAGRPVPKHV